MSPLGNDPHRLKFLQIIRIIDFIDLIDMGRILGKDELGQKVCRKIMWFRDLQIPHMSHSPLMVRADKRPLTDLECLIKNPNKGSSGLIAAIYKTLISLYIHWCSIKISGNVIINSA